MKMHTLEVLDSNWANFIDNKQIFASIWLVKAIDRGKLIWPTLVSSGILYASAFSNANGTILSLFFPIFMI